MSSKIKLLLLWGDTLKRYGFTYGLWAFILKFQIRFLNDIKPPIRILKLSYAKDKPPVSIRAGTSDRLSYIQTLKSDELSPLRSLQNIRTIIDCGAYIGTASIYMMNYFKDASCVCVEPDSENFRMLELNLAPYRERCNMIRAALWESDCDLYPVPLKNKRNKWAFNFRQAGPECPSDTIPGYSFETLICRSGFENIDLVKIDIEKSDIKLLHNLTEKTAAKLRNIVIETHSREAHDLVLKKLKPLFSRYRYQGEHHYLFGNKYRTRSTGDRF